MRVVNLEHQLSVHLAKAKEMVDFLTKYPNVPDARFALKSLLAICRMLLQKIEVAKLKERAEIERIRQQLMNYDDCWKPKPEQLKKNTFSSQVSFN